MVKDRTIKFWIPFVVALTGTYFLSGADLFENFGTRLNMLQSNHKLLWLLVTGDGLQAVGCLVAGVIFFFAWKKNRYRPFWFNDLMWQLSVVFICWFIACVISMLGTYWLYLWLNGMFRLLSGIFFIYVANTVLAARVKLFHPETPQEALRKAEKYEELIEQFKKFD
jgi:amino acid transporter